MLRLAFRKIPPPSHVCKKNSAGVNGEPSGGSSVHRPGSEDPHWCQRKFVLVFTNTTNNTKMKNNHLSEMCKLHSKMETYFVNFVVTKIEREVSIKTIEDQEKYSGCICIFQERISTLNSWTILKHLVWKPCSKTCVMLISKWLDNAAVHLSLQCIFCCVGNKTYC